MYNPSLLIELRELCGVSLEEAGFKANVTAEAIARAEMGGGAVPHNLLLYYSDVLGVKVKILSAFFIVEDDLSGYKKFFFDKISNLLYQYLKLSKWMCSQDEKESVKKISY